MRGEDAYKEIKEKPRGKHRAAQGLKAAPKELARRSARDSVARMREQLRDNRAKEQPQDYGSEKIEGGAQSGAALVVRGAEKLITDEKRRLAQRRAERKADVPEQSIEPDGAVYDQPLTAAEGKDVREKPKSAHLRERPASVNRDERGEGIPTSGQPLQTKSAHSAQNVIKEKPVEIRQKEHRQYSK